MTWFGIASKWLQYKAVKGAKGNAAVNNSVRKKTWVLPEYNYKDLYIKNLVWLYKYLIIINLKKLNIAKKNIFYIIIL